MPKQPWRGDTCRRSAHALGYHTITNPLNAEKNPTGKAGGYYASLALLETPYGRAGRYSSPIATNLRSEVATTTNCLSPAM